MSRKLLIIDTSILCVWLKVCGKETCGSGEDVWNFDKVDKIIQDEMGNGTYFVIPLATIIETGNHISQSSNYRYERAKDLTTIISDCIEEKKPWIAFSHQVDLWSNQKLRNLIVDWPSKAAGKISIGDTTIIDVAKYYDELNFDVQIFTADKGLKSHEPASPNPVPRRRKNK